MHLIQILSVDNPTQSIIIITIVALSLTGWRERKYPRYRKCFKEEE